jgi:hypothetical protein
MPNFRRTVLLEDALRLDESRLGHSACVVDIYTDEHTPVASSSEARRLAELRQWAAATSRMGAAANPQLAAAGTLRGSRDMSATHRVGGAASPSHPPPTPPRRSTRQPPAPPMAARSSKPPPPPSRTTGRTVVPAALARTSTVSKADALLPEMAHDPHYYPGLVPAAHERTPADDAETPAFRKPLPKWVWHAAAGAGLFLAGLVVASLRGGHETSTAPLQAAPVEKTTETHAVAPVEPAPTAEPTAQAAVAAQDNPVTAQPSETATTPLSARELAKQRWAERRAAWLARRASRKEHAASTKPSNYHTSSPAARAGVATTTHSVAAASGGKMGTLQINSRPWADIYIDNKLVGHTPQMGLPLSAGHHTIKLVNPAMSLSKTLSVTIHGGETMKKIETLGN